MTLAPFAPMARFDARAKLGRLLAKVDRESHNRRSMSRSETQIGFRAYLREINLDKTRAKLGRLLKRVPNASHDPRSTSRLEKSS